MRASCFECLTEREVEDWALRKLTGEQFAHVEEHLLFCTLCLDRVEEEERFVADLRAGLRHVEESNPDRAHDDARRAGFAGFLDDLWNRPLAWMGGTAAVLAAILLAVVLVPRQPGTAPETLVALSVQRSGSTAEVTSAPAEAALRLSVDVTELPQMAQYRLEIVDGRGARVGQAIVPRTGRTLAWSSPKLAAGSYWVRVYDAGGKGPLLREYALRAK